jgi:hypothetical protein
MESADVLYGVTMQEAGASKLIGMRLRDSSDRAPESVVPISRPEPEIETEEGEGPAAEEAAA